MTRFIPRHLSAIAVEVDAEAGGVHALLGLLHAPARVRRAGLAEGRADLVDAVEGVRHIAEVVGARHR